MLQTPMTPVPSAPRKSVPSRPAFAPALFLVLLLGALPVLRTLRVAAMHRFLATRTYEDIYYLPPPAWLRVMSLGYHEALADLVWIRVLIYFGDELVHRRDVVHVFQYADAVLALDPSFRRIYHWAAMAASYNAGHVTAKDLRRSVAYLEEGARRFPDDGNMAWDLGASILYDLEPNVTDPAEKRRLRKEGVAHMLVAARLGAGPPWLALANATQLQKLGETELAAQHLEEMYATVRDPAVKKNIADTLAALRSKAFAEAFRHANREVEQRRQRDFPYLDSTLYLLVGRRPLVDEGALVQNHFLPLHPWTATADADRGTKAAAPPAQ